MAGLEDLVPLNAFGVIRVTQKDVTIMLTSMKASGSAVNRSLILDLEEPPAGIEPGEMGSALLGVRIEEGKKAVVVFRELGELRSGLSLQKLPQTNSAIKQAIDLLRNAIST